MAVGSAIAGVYGIGKTVLPGILGGGEKGSGTTKPNTLAHAIDKLEKANDFEAIEAAEGALQLALQGKSDLEVSNFILQSVGYEPDGSLTSSHKWDYISRMLNQAVREVERRQGSTSNGTVPGMSVSPGTVTQAGIGWPMIVAIVGIIASLIYYANQ